VVERLRAFHGWLRTEALDGGGIGPAEAKRLWSRHLADSLTFLAALPGVASVVDVGSGIGLPGIPLAIALPDARITLLDRSERRCWLARRATRVLGLHNVEVMQADAMEVSLPHAAAISRAALPLDEFFSVARRMLPYGSVAVAAGSHGASGPVEGGWELIRVPAELLGESAWLAKVSLSIEDDG